MERLGLGATFRQEKEGTEGRSNIHQGRKELGVVVSNRNKYPDKSAGQVWGGE